MKVLAQTVIVIAFSACTGCATITTGGGPDQRIRISSEPRGARVTVDGAYKGETPTSVSMTRKDDHVVRLELSGFEPYEADVKSGMNLMTFGNIIVGGLVGVGVDLISGATTALNPGEIDAKLSPTAGAHTSVVNSSNISRKVEYYPSGTIK